MSTFTHLLNGVVPVEVEVGVDRCTNDPVLESVTIGGVELEDLTTVGELQDGQWVALETILVEKAAAFVPELIAGQIEHERETWRAPIH